MFNSNPIEINKSSLVSLKAEILRKQQEVNLSKTHEKTKPTKLDLQKKIKKEEASRDTSKKFDDNEENEELLAKSRQMLENKANLYNTLSNKKHLSERDKEITKRLLVQFDKKDKIDEPEEIYDSDDYEAKNPDEEWVEYVDFLGRTRKCLRKDLEYMKRKDGELCQSVDPERVSNTQNLVQDTEKDTPSEILEINEESELLSGDMRSELLRREWESQERELLNKKNIHYQDVLFNEARSHGVGYYAFSKDEEQRLKQQQNLNKLRQETKQQQDLLSEQKKLREKQMAARLKAARNRKRARMGLPPEEDEPENTEQESSIIDEETQQKEAEKEALEKAKQEERSKFVRPWDIGKEILKQHYEHSQEEWVEKQRKERKNEFAPPRAYSNYNLKRNIEITEENKGLYFTTKKKRSINPYINSDDEGLEKETSSSTRSEDRNSFIQEPRFSNYEQFRNSNLIERLQTNYVQTNVEVDDHFKTEFMESRVTDPPIGDPKILEDSVAACLKFLREQSEQNHTQINNFI